MNGAVIKFEAPRRNHAADARCRHLALIRDMARVIENTFQRFDHPTTPRIQELLDRAYDAAGLVKVYHSEAPGGYVSMTRDEANARLADLLGKRPATEARP